MGFFGTDHVDALQGSAGPTITFGQGFDIGYDRQYKVDSFYALEAELRDRWLKNMELFNSRTGQNIDLPSDMTAMNNYASAAFGEDASIWGKTWKVGWNGLTEISQEQRDKFKVVNDQIKAMGASADKLVAGQTQPFGVAQLQSFEEILADVMKMRQEVEGQSALASETFSTGGAIGEFLGLLAGSFSRRDPLLVATLPIGGFGRTAAARIGTEMLSISAVEAVQQFGKVQPTREMLGEPEGSPWANVLLAGLGAGILRGGAEGIGKLAQRLTRVDPAEQEAALRQFFEDNPQSPRARAGLSILEDAERLEAASPYGPSPIGMRRFVAELEDVRNVLGGQADTAIARVLPEIPFESIEKNVDFQIVKERSPEVYAKMEEARAAVQRAADQVVDPFNSTKVVDPDGKPLVVYHGSPEKELQALEPRITTRGKGDIEGVFFTGDQMTASNFTRPAIKDRVGALKDKRGKVYAAHINLQNPLDITDTIKKAQKKGLSFGDAKRQAMQAVDRNIHDGVIFRGDKVNSAEFVAFRSDQIRLIGQEPSSALPTRAQITSMRRAANAAYRKALAAVERELDAIKTVEALVRGKQQAAAVDLLGHSITRPVLGSELSHVVVAEHAAKVAASAERIDDVAEGLVRAADTAPEGLVQKVVRAVRGEKASPEMIDIGLPKPVPADFAFDIDGKTVTLREVMDDLGDDLKLEEAVRSCLI